MMIDGDEKGKQNELPTIHIQALAFESLSCPSRLLGADQGSQSVIVTEVMLNQTRR